MAVERYLCLPGPDVEVNGFVVRAGDVVALDPVAFGAIPGLRDRLVTPPIPEAPAAPATEAPRRVARAQAGEPL